VRVFQVVTRVLAFIGKELVEVARRPGAIVSLVLGPFLIMAVFGFGYQGFRRPLQVALIVPADSGLPRDAGAYQDVIGTGLELASVTEDEPGARANLAQGTIDLIVIAPPDGEAALREGRRSQVVILYNELDPVQESYTLFLAERLEAEVNREIIRRAAGESQAYVVAQGQAEAALIEPDVIAAPTDVTTENISPTATNLVSFYSPAVLALILQHMAVSLIAISVVRERSSGVMEVYRVSPISATEILIGKLIAYGILAAVIAAATVGLLVGLLGVPMLSGAAPIAGVIALLVLASLGMGVVIALIADSERQAVQLTLLVLLASVFFSGFVIAIDEFRPEVRPLSYAIPATHGIRLFQDLMLRGGTDAVWQLGALALIAVLLLVVSWVLLRTRMRGA
jgi:ABC-2 type transport system permease protein